MFIDINVCGKEIGVDLGINNFIVKEDEEEQEEYIEIYEEYLTDCDDMELQEVRISLKGFV